MTYKLKDVLTITVLALVAGGALGVFIGDSFPIWHTHPLPTRLNIQKHWIEVHDSNWKIQNTLDSQMLDTCSIECDPDYIAIMEAEEKRVMK